MKNKILIAVILSSFLSFVSCNDSIDIVQDGEINNDATFVNVTNLEAYLLGDVYPNISGETEMMFTSIFTDEVGIGPSNGGQAIDTHRFVLSQNDGYAASIWLQNYRAINRANRLIEGSANFTPASTELAKYNSIIASARVIRALSYLQLLTYFSTDMANDNALGVIYSDKVPAIDDKSPRVINAQIYSLIEGDLTFADANLIDPTTTDKFKYVSKNLVSAIRARMYLYRKNYTLAKQYAQQTLTNSGLTLTAATPYVAATFYSTTTTNPYRKMWADLDANGGEILFSLSRPSSGSWSNFAGNFYFNTTTLTGGAYLDMGKNLYTVLNETAGDIRRMAFVDPTSDIAANDVMIDKYPGKPAGAPLRNDIKMFRLSEMYFILAECAVYENQLVTVAQYIKNVRDARNRLATQPLPSYADATQAWGDILKERRRELCFEGHRYIDIKRLGALANTSIDRNVADDVILSVPLTLPLTDHRFTMPIPQDEISANPNAQQNPGY